MSIAAVRPPVRGFTGSVSYSRTSASCRLAFRVIFSTFTFATATGLSADTLVKDRSFRAVFERASGGVSTIFPTPDGGYIVGGQFEVISGTTALEIAKLNSDLTVDVSFNPPIENIRRPLAVQSDGKVITVRQERDPVYSSQVVSRIDRLMPDGSVDESFEFDQTFRSLPMLVLQPDDKILLRSPDESRLLRLLSDGSVDETFSPSFEKPGGDGMGILPLAITTDGRMIFQSPAVASINGQPVSGAIMLNPDGSTNPDFSFPLAQGDRLTGVLPLGDGSFLMGGRLWEGSSRIDAIRKVDSSGMEIEGFLPRPSARVWDGVKFSVNHHPSWAVAYRGIRQYLMKIAPDGSVEKEVVLNEDHGAVSFLVIGEDVILAAGSRGVSVDPALRQPGDGLIRVDLSGEQVATSVIGTGLRSTPVIGAIGHDQKLYVMGEFERLNGESVGKFLRLNADGSRDPSFNPGSGFSNPPLGGQIFPQSDGKVMIAGDITTYNGQAVRPLIRLNYDGSLDTSFISPERSSLGYSTRVGQLSSGGYFAVYGNRLVKLSEAGVIDETFAFQNPTGHWLEQFAESSDGKVFVLANGVVRLLDSTGVQLEETNEQFDIAAFAVGTDDSVFGSILDYEFRENSSGNEVLVRISRVIKFTPELRRDEEFASESSPNVPTTSSVDAPRNIWIDPDGGIVVDWAFGPYRLNADGTIDPEFEIFGVTHGRDPSVSSGVTGLPPIFTPLGNGDFLISGREHLNEWDSILGIFKLTPYDIGEIILEVSNDALVEGGVTVLSAGTETEGPFVYEWRRNGLVIEGATGSSMTVGQASFADEGIYQVAITDALGSGLSPEVNLSVTPDVSYTRTLDNLRFRSIAENDIPTYLALRIEGSVPKRLLITAAGPNLARFGLSGALRDPVLRVLNATGGEIAANRRWEEPEDDLEVLTSAFVQVGAVPFEADSNDAALVASLNPGSHIIEVRGDGGGDLLLQIFDLDAVEIDSRIAFAAHSSRFLRSGELVTMGIGITEGQSRDLLVRGVGSGNSVWRGLVDPQIHITSILGQVVAANEEWSVVDVPESVFNLAQARSLTADSGDAAVVIRDSASAFTVAFKSNLQPNPSKSIGSVELYDLVGRSSITSPVILVPPFSQDVPEGTAGVFEVTAAGLTPFSYQWLKDGQPIEGEQSAHLVLNSLPELDQSWNISVRVSNGAGTITTAPVALTTILGGHSADHDRDFRLSLSELLRVIELYNTRSGTIRSGRYRQNVHSIDGFDVDDSSADAHTPTRWHSADSSRDGRISLSELLRVIELYNTRVGTLRTGSYRTSIDTIDGFEPDLE